MTELIQLEKKGNILTIWLNRPQKKNALNAAMIDGLLHIARELQNDENTDIVVLKGRGDCFCAGADLEWFKYTIDLPENERVQILKTLPVFLRTWNHLPQTTITVGHGFLYGGALGLLAVSDFVILEQDSHLRLSEVLIGIIPASIAPYLLKRMGFKRSKSLMLSAEAFNAQLALAYGLADKIGSLDDLAEMERHLIENIQRSDKQTRRVLKKFLLNIVNKEINEELTEYTARALSDLLGTELAQKKIDAFTNPSK